MTYQSTRRWNCIVWGVPILTLLIWFPSQLTDTNWGYEAQNVMLQSISCLSLTLFLLAYLLQMLLVLHRGKDDVLFLNTLLYNLSVSRSLSLSLGQGCIQVMINSVFCHCSHFDAALLNLRLCHLPGCSSGATEAGTGALTQWCHWGWDQVSFWSATVPSFVLIIHLVSTGHCLRWN